MGGRVCLRIRACPRLLSDMLRRLSWSESMSCMLSLPRTGRAILGREPSWKRWKVFVLAGFLCGRIFCSVMLWLPWWCVGWTSYRGPWLCPASCHQAPSYTCHRAPGDMEALADCGLEEGNRKSLMLRSQVPISPLTLNSPSINCLCCWMISSHRWLYCSKRCTTKFFCRMTLSFSSACDCISAFSISSSWTLQRRPRTSRCSSELTLRGSSSSRRRAWSRSSTNWCSSRFWWQQARSKIDNSLVILSREETRTKPTFCFWIFFCSAARKVRFSRASSTSWVSVVSGGDSVESESFSLSSFLTLSFLLSARHLLLRLLLSCSQLRKEKRSGNFKDVSEVLV